MLLESSYEKDFEKCYWDLVMKRILKNVTGI